MAQVTVTIDGKQFRMACEDGQEAHLEGLATLVDERVRMMRQSFGEIGDLRLTVMAALMVADELSEEKRKGAALQAERESERRARSDVADTASQRDQAIAHQIDALSQRVERIARLLAGNGGT